MKNLAFLLVLVAFLSVSLSPTATFARGGNSGSNDDDSHYSDDDDEDEDDDDDSNDDDSDDSDDSDDDSNDDSDDDSSSSLEIEADVFNDTTIVKVEKNDAKTIFETDADTRDEVIAVILDRFDLTEEEVDDVLDFEVENRASRAQERAKVGEEVRVHDSDDDDDSCDSSTSSSTLEVEADVFTNTTIVKVEKSGTVTVFETDADTKSEVVSVVASRFNVSTGSVESVIDFEIEDRASRTTDFDSSSSSDDCDDDSDDDSNRGENRGPGNTNTSSNDAELRAKIAKLQELIQALIKLFNAQFGGTL